MSRNVNHQKKKGSLVFAMLVFCWCLAFSPWEGPAFCATDKEIMLSPQGSGGAWNLPAGQYGEDEQTGSSDNQGGPQLPGKEVMQIPGREDRLCLGMEAWDREGPRHPGEGAVRVPMGRRDRQISRWGPSPFSCR
jgi:hypothetical protein